MSLEEAFGHPLDSLIGRDAWSAWYRADVRASTPYRDAPQSVVIRLFDEPRDAYHVDLLDEARVGISFQHPCVWGPVEWPADQRACRVTGVDGWRLIDVVRAGAVPPATAVQVGRDLCKASLYLESHSLGPGYFVPDGERIIIGRDGVTRVQEPMSARFPPSVPHVAQLMPPVGAFVLMSPERIKGMPITTTSAVREIGAVLHALLTGTLALRRASLFETLQAAISGPLPLLVGRDDLDPALASLVDTACALEPADRFQALTDLSAALDDIAARLGRAVQSPDAILESPAELVPFLAR